MNHETTRPLPEKTPLLRAFGCGLVAGFLAAAPKLQFLVKEKAGALLTQAG
jgi:hypothetical protein